MPLLALRSVSLSGGSSRFDYQSLDGGRRLLWISHLGANEVLAVDTDSGRVVRTVRGISAPHGVLVVPALDRVFAAAAGSHQLVAIQASTGRILYRTPAGTLPDGIAYAPTAGRVFVSDEEGGAEVVTDAPTGRPLRVLRLGTQAGNAQYDPLSDRILVAVDNDATEQLAAIDPHSLQVIRRVTIPGCDTAHGLHLDTRRRLAFLACAGNARLFVIDLRTMHIRGPPYTVGENPDVLDFDPSLGRLYVAAESGIVAVFAECAGALRSLGAYRAPFAHTVAVDPATHRVFLPLQDARGGPVLRILTPAEQTP